MTHSSTPRRKRGFTLVEVIVVLGIIIGLSSVIYGYVQSAQQSAQTSQMIQDVDYIRSAALSFGQTQGGRYNNISANRLVALGLLPSRFTCGNAETAKGANDPDAVTIARLSECTQNPFNASWTLAPVTMQDGQYTMTVYTERSDKAFYDALGLRYGTIYQPMVAQMGNGRGAPGSADAPAIAEKETEGNFSDIERVVTDESAQTLTLTLEP